jgi:hypothetical protein
MSTACVQKQLLLPCTASCWFIAWLTPQPCRWRPYVPPKRLLTFNGQHVMSWRQNSAYQSCENLKSYRLQADNQTEVPEVSWRLVHQCDALPCGHGDYFQRPLLLRLEQYLKGLHLKEPAMSNNTLQSR